MKKKLKANRRKKKTIDNKVKPQPNLTPRQEMERQDMLRQSNIDIAMQRFYAGENF